VAPHLFIVREGPTKAAKLHPASCRKDFFCRSVDGHHVPDLPNTPANSARASQGERSGPNLASTQPNRLSKPSIVVPEDKRNCQGKAQGRFKARACVTGTDEDRRGEHQLAPAPNSSRRRFPFNGCLPRRSPGSDWPALTKTRELTWSCVHCLRDPRILDRLWLTSRHCSGRRCLGSRPPGCNRCGALLCSVKRPAAFPQRQLTGDLKPSQPKARGLAKADPRQGGKTDQPGAAISMKPRRTFKAGSKGRLLAEKRRPDSRPPPPPLALTVTAWRKPTRAASPVLPSPPSTLAAGVNRSCGSRPRDTNATGPGLYERLHSPTDIAHHLVANLSDQAIFTRPACCVA